MQKTPDEIKKALDICPSAMMNQSCVGCPWHGGNDSFCSETVMRDALAYIQQLEEDNAKKHEKIMQLNIAFEDMQGIVQSITQDSKSTFQQLETKCHQLLANCKQLERERDAAVADFKSHLQNVMMSKGPYACNICKNRKTAGYCHEDECDGASHWEWRGVKEE